MDLTKYIKRLRAAGYHSSTPDDDLASAWEWAFRDSELKPTEVEIRDAITAYAGSPGDRSFMPSPNQILAKVEMARAERVRYWREPEYEGPFVTVEELRAAWIEAGVLPPEYGQ